MLPNTAKPVSPKRKWMHYGLKTLAVVVLAATTPFFAPIKTYEGKPWKIGFWGSTHPSARGRYVVQRYVSMCGYGMTRFRWYRDSDGDGSVDQVLLSIDYPSWMGNTPLLNRLLPRDDQGDLSKLEVWERGDVAAYTLEGVLTPTKTIMHLYRTPEEVANSNAKEVFDRADTVFHRWYPKKENTMPYEPKDNERWALFPWLKEK